MKAVKIVLLLLIVITLSLDGSWLWAVFGGPRTYLEALLGAVPYELEVTGFDFVPTFDGSITVWDFRVPRDVADSLQRRCVQPATLEVLPLQPIPVQNTPPEKITNPGGCLIARKSVGTEQETLSLALEEDRLQLTRNL